MRRRWRRRAAGARQALAGIVCTVAALVPGPGPAVAQAPAQKGPPEHEVTGPERGEPRIVGGTQAAVGAYPWHVIVDIRFVGRCGGTLVSTRWVMTAAHCVSGSSPADITLTIGRTVRSDPSQGETRTAAQVLVHPSYNPATQEFDVALVRASSPATHRWARPALAGDPFQPGNVVRAIGHGATCEGCAGSDRLLQVDLPVQSDATMADLFGPDFKPATMLGAGPVEGGKDTCQGDSGGPLFVPGRLQPAVVGVTSWGFGCARPDSPGVYTELAADGIRSFLATNVPRPVNDNLASATALSGASGQVTGTTTDASGQVGEPAHAGSEADTTVWYSWTAPSAAPVTFTTPTAAFDPTLAVYTGGSVTGLSLVAADDDSVGLLPRATFTPAAGTTYRVAVDGFNAAWGTFELAWGPAPAGGAAFDFTGDERADATVYRPATGEWFVNGASPGLVTWGASGDRPALLPAAVYARFF